jgi:Tfp pilus assembly protein PilX
MFGRTDAAPVTNREGFALPLAILVIGMLTAAVAAGFAATASEAVVNNAQRAQERAYQIAEAGLQQFMVRRSESGFCTGCQSDPTAAVDSEYTRVQLNGGYADVVAKRVWNPSSGTSSPMFFIRSKGIDTAARMSVGGGTVFAERTVGVYAKWSNTTINVLGAMMSFNGVYRGTSGTISGSNACSGSSIADVPPVTMPTLSGKTGSWGTIAEDDTLPFATLSANQAINWDQVIANAVTADVTIPPGSWPATYTTWPVIRVKNSASGILPAAGQGLILADSNFRIPAGADWNGVILVGGRLTAPSGSGTSNIRGAVVTGLNRLLSTAGSPPVGVSTDNDSLLENALTIRYYPCYVTDAGHKLRGYTPMANTWMDNVANW